MRRFSVGRRFSAPAPPGAGGDAGPQGGRNCYWIVASNMERERAKIAMPRAPPLWPHCRDMQRRRSSTSGAPGAPRRASGRGFVRTWLERTLTDEVPFTRLGAAALAMSLALGVGAPCAERAGEARRSWPRRSAAPAAPAPPAPAPHQASKVDLVSPEPPVGQDVRQGADNRQARPARRCATFGRRPTSRR